MYIPTHIEQASQLQMSSERICAFQKSILYFEKHCFRGLYCWFQGWTPNQANLVYTPSWRLAFFLLTETPFCAWQTAWETIQPGCTQPVTLAPSEPSPGSLAATRTRAWRAKSRGWTVHGMCFVSDTPILFILEAERQKAERWSKWWWCV